MKRKVVKRVSCLVLIAIMSFITPLQSFATSASDNTVINSECSNVTGEDLIEKDFSEWSILPDLEINKKILSESIDKDIRSNSDIWENECKKLEQMSIDELNAYINNINKVTSGNESENNGNTTSASNAHLSIKAAWLAAAEIAKRKGYPCAAKAVKCSVLGINYSENNGMFSKKIKTTSVFKKRLSIAKNSKKNPTTNGMIFTKSSNKDLFYALHKVNDKFQKSGKKYKITVTDTFDFAVDNQYKSLFTSTVNNWAWLCQHTGILKKIKITIHFTV